jgi:hypothetical protein
MLRVGPLNAPMHLNGFSFRSSQKPENTARRTPSQLLLFKQTAKGRLTRSVVKSESGSQFLRKASS